MIQIGKKSFGISGFAIRLLAIIFMVLAVIGYEKGPGYDWMEAFSWTSFVLFAFLLVEGIEHTTDKGLYFRRFLIFTAIGETVYTFYRTGKFWSPKFFSSMTTLFLGFIVLLIVTFIRDRFENIVLDMAAIGGLGYGAYQLAERFNFDFGGLGIILIIAFYIARNVTYTKITQLVVIFYVSFYMTEEVLTIVSVGGLQYPVAPQLYSLLALPFIWLYNDNRGLNAVGVQLLQYLIYPIMLGLLILYKTFLG